MKLNKDINYSYYNIYNRSNITKQYHNYNNNCVLTIITFTTLQFSSAIEELE